jgi:hypothetical protein
MIWSRGENMVRQWIRRYGTGEAMNCKGHMALAPDQHG